MRRFLIFLALAALTVPLWATPPFSGGTGTESDPYLVSSAEALNAIRNYPNAHFRQTSSIDLVGEWLPIPNFTGVYDGENHVIHGVHISGNPDYAGFINVLWNGYLKNVTFTGVDIVGGFHTGGIAAEMNSSTLDNVRLIGRVEGLDYVGGLVGACFNNSSIINSSVSVTVNGVGSVGALIGESSGSTIRNVVVEGRVSGNSYVGGLYGFSTYSTIEDVYSLATVTGASSVGGLAGRDAYGGYDQVYVSGSVFEIGNGVDIDPLIGFRNNMSVVGVYWNTDFGRATSILSGAVGLTTTAMRNPASFVGFDFAGAWTSVPGSFPYLATNTPTSPPGLAGVPAAIQGVRPGVFAMSFLPKPVFTWDPDVDADHYTFEISTSPRFPSAQTSKTENIQAAEFELATPLSVNTTYYWRVRGFNDGVIYGGDWSQTHQLLVSSPSNPGGVLAFELDRYVDVPYAEELNPAGTFTVEFWAKPTQIGSLAIPISSRADQYHGYQILISDQGNWFVMLGATTQWVELQGPEALVDEWQHVALTYGNGVARFYINGDLVDTESLTHLPNRNGKLKLGAIALENPHNSYPFIGSLDDVRVWSVEKSIEQLRRQMYQTAIGTELGLAGAWNFDETSGMIAYDATDAAHFGWIRNNVRQTDDHPATGAFIEGTADAWHFLANPTPGVTLAEFLAPLWTQGAAGSDLPGAGSPNVFRLNESTWSYQAVTDLNVEATPGKGWLVRVYKDDVFGVAGTFPKRLTGSRMAFPGSVPLPVTYTAGSAFSGFNLVGNPYPNTITWEQTGPATENVSPTMYVYDQTQNSYRTWNRTLGTGTNGGSPYIAPFQGFILQTTSASAQPVVSRMNLSAGGTPLHKEVVRSSNAFPSLRLTLEQGARTEETVLMFNRALGQITPTHPTLQLVPMDDDRFLIYTLDDQGRNIDLAELPSTIESYMEIPIRLDVSTEGRVMLNALASGLPSDWDVVLKDHRTGALVPLLASKSHTFDHNVTTPSGARFSVLVGPVIDSEAEEGPLTFGLDQNFPNPFNPSTVIRFTVGTQDLASLPTRLTVYDILGREVAVLVDGVISAGAHQVRFDASGLASGVYLYRLSAGNEVITKRMLLLK